MTYTPTNWQDEPSTATPLSAANLNKMEAGIDGADQAAADANTNLTTHTTATTAHSATAAATASRMVVRDAAGRAAFAAPSASGDAATKGYVDTADALAVPRAGTGAVRIWPASSTFPTTGVQDGDLFPKLP